MYIGKGLIATVLILLATPLYAQDDVEYNWEFGAGIGMMNYTGDFNSSLMSGKSMSPGGSVVLRRTFNPYSHMRMSLTYGGIKVRAEGLDTFYPDYNTDAYGEPARQNYTIDNSVLDMSFVYEYNFWPYGTGRDYRGAQRITPFMAIGLGFTYGILKNGSYDASEIAYDSPAPYGEPKYEPGNPLALNLPIGFGVKYKVGDRTNLSLQWLCHITTTDKLDGVKDPYRIASSGIFKNTDCYSMLEFAVTYSFGPKCKHCMNSDWSE